MAKGPSAPFFCTLSRDAPRLEARETPKAHTTLDAGSGVTLRFYPATASRHCAPSGPATSPRSSTSPPYNLGMSYRSYKDSLPRASYLEWSDVWIKAAARALAPQGSLFLNVGAKPTDPWTAMDVAQAARAHLQLQNMIHWIKSIAIDQETAGAAAGLDRGPGSRPLQADQQRTVPERLPRVRLSFHARGPHAARPPRDRRGLPGRVEHRPLARPAAATALPRERLVHPVRDDSEPRQDRPHPATFPPRLPSIACACTGSSRVRLVMDPFLGLGSTAVACAELGVNFVGIELDEHYLAEAIARTRSALSRA